MDLSSTVTQPVSGLMSSPVAAVDAGATLREIAEAMAANEIGAVTVLADGHLAGIVSERDVVTHLADGAHPDHLLAEDMFTAEFVSAAPQDRLVDVARRMVTARVRHVPVLEDGQAVGMVSMRDVAAVLVAALG